MIIRSEEPDDLAAIAETIRDAFLRPSHSSGTEAEIVDALRTDGALTVSLVAMEDDAVVGHVAISPVSVTGEAGWYGLGPVSVCPDGQNNGIGSLLIKEALRRIKEHGAAGCVVLGDPEFYKRFGFVHDPNVTYADVPPPYFQVLSFGPPSPQGTVHYHQAFGE